MRGREREREGERGREREREGERGRESERRERRERKSVKEQLLSDAHIKKTLSTPNTLRLHHLVPSVFPISEGRLLGWCKHGGVFRCTMRHDK